MLLIDTEFPLLEFTLPCSLLPCSFQHRQRLITTLLACALDEPGQQMFQLEAGDILRLVCFICEQILQPENVDITFDSQKIIAVC